MRQEPIRIALDGGKTVLLRLLQKTDRAELAGAAEELSARSRYYRFHTPGLRLSDDDLSDLTDVDQIHHVAWVVLDPNTKKGLAIGRYVRDGGDDSSAEIALTVRDQDQHQGLAKVLLGALLASALAGGVKRFHGTILAGNLPMRHLLASLRARIDLAKAGAVSVEMSTNPEQVCDTPTAQFIRDVAVQVRQSRWLADMPQ